MGGVGAGLALANNKILTRNFLKMRYAKDIMKNSAADMEAIFVVRADV